MGQLRRKDLIYPELSYQIVGVLFEVWNKLGPGHHENYYQKAVTIGLKNCNLNFREQVYIPLNFKGERVGSYYLDFVIENKIVLEIKKGDRFSRTHIEQVLSYLKASNLKLGILANFGSKGVKIQRIINFQ